MVSQARYDALLAEKEALEAKVIELQAKLSRKGRRISDTQSHGIVYRKKPSQDLSGVAALLHAGWSISAVADEYRVTRQAIAGLITRNDLANWEKWRAHDEQPERES